MPVVVVPVMSPVYLFGLDALDIVLRDHGRFRGVATRRRKTPLRRNRRQWCCFRARSQCCGARGEANGDSQKVAAFHDISLLVVGE
jgi:hypothetical protein